MASITSLPSGVFGSSLVLISEQTASSSANITFDSDIDSTYKEYVFKFINMQSASTDVAFQVNFRDGGSSYDATKTTTYFYTEHGEGGQGGTVGYLASRDEAQSSDAQHLTTNIGRTGSDSASGTLHLFDPSSTTFVKHFTSVVSNHDTTSPGYSQAIYVGGYCNVTAAIDGVQFTMSSGNIAAGTIKMYGVV
tara:strand:- start:14 stop:592 length:579 start_codon:yes stop_codon:yes gene_type:complete